jgi:4-amino-4-deoxy-L-arabinose transferase-like glycosyltransferase
VTVPLPEPAFAVSSPFVTRGTLVLVAGLLLLQLATLAVPDLFPEEAYYWLYARHLDIGYLDHPPMVAWLIGLGTTVFGVWSRRIWRPHLRLPLPPRYLFFRLSADRALL